MESKNVREAIDPAEVEQEEKKKKKKGAFWWSKGFWICFAAVAAAGVTVAVLFGLGLLQLPTATKPLPIVAGDLFPGEGGDVEDGGLPGLTEEEILERMQRVADANYFSFSINARPYFVDGSAKGNLQIENPSNNVYPMVVEIYLEDGNELIYSSGGVLPNQHIQEAQLTKKLSAGIHKATAHLNLYDPDTKEWAGEQLVALEIQVLN